METMSFVSQLCSQSSIYKQPYTVMGRAGDGTDPGSCFTCAGWGFLFYFSFQSYRVSETRLAWLLRFSAMWVVGFVHFPGEKSDVTNALRMYTNLERKEQICLLKNIPVLLLVEGKV